MQRRHFLNALALPDWLFEACSNQVGDSAETVSLLWGQQNAGPQEQSQNRSLAEWMGQILPELAAAEAEASTAVEEAAVVVLLARLV